MAVGRHDAEALALLRSVGALLEGHFQYASGRHGGVYVEKFRLLEDPAATEQLCERIAAHFAGASVEILAGPTTGGALLAFETARQMGLHSFIAERGEQGGRVFHRGFRFQPGQRTLIVDDVLTTGGSVVDTIAAVRAAGGDPVGVGLVVDRSGGRVDLGLPSFACMTLDFDSYPPDACPLCRDGVPLTVT